MFSFQKILVIIGLLIMTYCSSAQNPDILWQKTLTKDTIPIASIAIAEGKYVAVLKGDEIIILDYKTGDSVKSFLKPSDMYGNDIVLGKNGERLYVFVGGQGSNVKSNIFLRSWDIGSTTALKDISMGSYKVNSIGVSTSYSYKNFLTSSSLNGKFIAVGSSNFWFMNSCSGSGGAIRLFNSVDSTIVLQNYSSDDNFPFFSTDKNHQLFSGDGGVETLKISHSGNYLLNNQRNYYWCTSGGYGSGKTTASGGFVSLAPNHSSYNYVNYINNYIFSYGEDFLIFGKLLYDFPPTRSIRSITKTGFAFLPDDNHMIAFKQGNGVAAISNIEKDSWEKVYQGDSLIENIIQINASRTAFATATNNRITLWKIPDTLAPASLTAGFTIYKDTLFIGDTLLCSNTTYPFKHGNHHYWNFDDGSETSMEAHPNHIFTKPGTFSVNLEVRDTLGRISTISKKVTVLNFRLPKNSVWVNRSSNNSITCLSYSRNGNLIVSGSNDNNVKLWNSSIGSSITSFTARGSIISTIFMNDGKSIALGTLLYTSQNQSSGYIDSYQNSLYIWNFENHVSANPYSLDVPFFDYLNEKPMYFKIHNYTASASLSSDNLIYICGHGVLMDWCVVDPTVIGTMGNGFSKFLQSNQRRGNILTYNFREQKLNYTNRCTSQFNCLWNTHSLQIFPDDRYCVAIIELNDGKPFFQVRGILKDSVYRQIPTTATSMHFSPDKFHLLTNTGLWNIYDSILVKTVDLPSTFEYHPDGIHVFTLRADSTIGIYNLNTNSYEYIYPKQPTTFTAIAVAPDGKHIATGDKYGYITVWNVPDSLKASFKVDFNTTLFKRSNLKENDTVTFANTTLPANYTFDFLWNFGDGTTSTERNPKHVYAKSGIYTVTLSALNNGKVIDSIIKLSYITIEGPLDTQEAKSSFETTFSIIPNPSYGETTLSYTLSQPSPVQIRITDVLGKEVNSWSLNESEGMHTLVWNGSSVGAGMYYCTFCAQGLIRTLPFVVLQ